MKSLTPKKLVRLFVGGSLLGGSAAADTTAVGGAPTDAQSTTTLDIEGEHVVVGHEGFLVDVESGLLADTLDDANAAAAADSSDAEGSPSVNDGNGSADGPGASDDICHSGASFSSSAAAPCDSDDPDEPMIFPVGMADNAVASEDACSSGGSSVSAAAPCDSDDSDEKVNSGDNAAASGGESDSGDADDSD